MASTAAARGFDSWKAADATDEIEEAASILSNSSCDDPVSEKGSAQPSFRWEALRRADRNKGGTLTLGVCTRLTTLTESLLRARAAAALGPCVLRGSPRHEHQRG